MNSQYEYAIEWVDTSSPHNFPLIFVHRNDENSIFQLWESKTCLIFTLSKCRVMFALIYFDMGHAFICLSQKSKNFNNFIYTKYMENCEAMTSINSLICIFILTVQEMFRWKSRKFKISYLHYVLSDLHQIFTVPFEFFYSFYWINLHLDRISPLNFYEF